MNAIIPGRFFNDETQLKIAKNFREAKCKDAWEYRYLDPPPIETWIINPKLNKSKIIDDLILKGRHFRLNIVLLGDDCSPAQRANSTIVKIFEKIELNSDS